MAAIEVICDDGLRMRISEQLARHPVIKSTEDGLRPAAVAIVVLDESYGADLSGLAVHRAWSNQAALLLTRRSSGLNHHPGQWALPGGRLDQGESQEQCALRELEEEVGLTLPPSQVLGCLDDFVTRSGFVMTPVVVWGGPGLDLAPDPREVASVHRIPIQEFMRSDAPDLEDIPESDRPVLRMPVGDTWIAAPTAALLYQFREVVMLGRTTRVAHFEQPVFAWR